MHKGELLPFSSQLMGFSRWLGPVPGYFWRRQRDTLVQEMEKALARLTPDQRRVYRLTVGLLAESMMPLEIIDAAARLGMTIDRTEDIINKLNKLTGLIRRNSNGSITGAYPVSLDKNRSCLILDSGEEMGVESPLDALALALVMGRLRGKDVSGHFTAKCSFCRRPLHFMTGGNLDLKWLEQDAEPRLFLPLATVKTETEGILFCLRNAVCYCSPEHAGEHRHQTGGVRGYYLTPEASADLMCRFVEVILPTAATP
jgi:hypothetical protein